MRIRDGNWARSDPLGQLYYGVLQGFAGAGFMRGTHENKEENITVAWYRGEWSLEGIVGGKARSACTEILESVPF